MPSHDPLEPSLPTPSTLRKESAFTDLQSSAVMWTDWTKTILQIFGEVDASTSGRTEPNAADQFRGPGNFGEIIAQEPVLRAIEGIFNANPFREVIPIDWAEISRALRTIWLRRFRHPKDAAFDAAQLGLKQFGSLIDIWSEASQRMFNPEQGAQTSSAAADKRFAAPEWQSNPAFRGLKELYLLASEWLLCEAKGPSDLSPAEQRHLEFHLRQFINAASPHLMLMSNPAALRRAVETGGASIADGLRNLSEDLKAGRLSMVDAKAFRPGRNLALSPGKVVYRNKLIELIQYESKTAEVFAIPILILPPWINKYYILDLQPKNSMVRHLAESGFTVFMVSWKNPDASMEGTTIDDYLELGPLAASDIVREITGSPALNVMGYCIGGTLLAMTLAFLSAKQDSRFKAATFMVSMQDFSKVGDTEMFLGEPTSVDFIEQQMLERGYLDSREMSNMFNLLRSNDLIWANVVNNYLLGQKPPAFDLLYWNSDGTRMARAAHGWYLRNTYVENNLVVRGKISLKGEPLDLGEIKQDVYAVGAEKDHIVPWKAAARIAELISGHVRFVLASSGHIAGIINPPGGKGAYWTNENGKNAGPDQWKAEASRHEGSWWPDWFTWLSVRSGDRVKPPCLGSETYPALQDAPGSYVLER